MPTTTITFALGEPARPFTPRRDPSNPWRLIGDEFAADLSPVCYALAQAVKHGDKPPLFDRLEIWPVQWGIPDSILTDHPAEVEELRRKLYDPKPEVEKAALPLADWLEQTAKRELWKKHCKHLAPELVRQWLTPVGGAGRALFLHARKRHFTNPLNVYLRDLERIRFRADFGHRGSVTTIYLDACLQARLTPDEERISPVFQAQERADLQAQRQTEAQKAETEALRAANLVAESKLASQRQAHSKATKSPTEQQRDRQKRQAAGAKTFQLVGHEKAAMQLIEYMRDFRQKEIRAGRKYGADKAAIAAGREWWIKNHTDPAAKAALNKDKVSASTLRRWIEKTPLRLKLRHREQ
jgi:hypothetical protein